VCRSSCSPLVVSASLLVFLLCSAVLCLLLVAWGNCKGRHTRQGRTPPLGARTNQRATRNTTHDSDSGDDCDRGRGDTALHSALACLKADCATVSAGTVTVAALALSAMKSSRRAVLTKVDVTGRSPLFLCTCVMDLALLSIAMEDLWCASSACSQTA
jgi:hypothetical protein